MGNVLYLFQWNTIGLIIEENPFHLQSHFLIVEECIGLEIVLETPEIDIA